jgi:exopolysaccharide biosynthesis polyprenyl glycosylphosphotransferase
MDVVMSLALLVLLLPLMLLVALAIRLDSPGAALLKQKRIGRDRVPFDCYKFRSMCVDAEAQRKALAHRNEMTGPVFKIRSDPRVTRVGRVLRKYSLDELPQLINVLKGEMSLVGPRPPLPEEVERYEPRHMKRLEVKPGLTCIWQVSGRNEICFERWVELDIEYIEHRSLWLDLVILVRTVPAVITARGAY